MADNVAITAGSGTSIAADEVGGAYYQRVKLSLGADNTAADAPVGGGTEAGTLRVTIASDSTGVLSVDDNGGALTVDNGGTFAVQAKPAEITATMKHARVALSAAQTGTTVLDPTGGTKCVLHKLVVSCSAAGTFQFFYDTDSGDDVIGPILTLAVGGGWSETWDLSAPRRSASADDILKYTTSAGATGSVYIEYWEE